MLNQVIADLLVFIHLTFIMFVIFGGLLVLRWKRTMFLHLPAAAWGALIEFQGWICPLTPLEQHFRHLAGQTGYRDSFIEHYLIPLIYPVDLTRPMQVAMGIFVIGINIVIYAYSFNKWRRSHD